MIEASDVRGTRLAVTPKLRTNHVDEKDVRSPLNVAEEMHAGIPGSKRVIMPGAPHLNDMEAADPFNAAARDFLNSLDPTPGPE